MSRYTSELTDAQWAHIAPLLPEPKASPKGGPQPLRSGKAAEKSDPLDLRQGRRFRSAAHSTGATGD